MIFLAWTSMYSWMNQLCYDQRGRTTGTNRPFVSEPPQRRGLTGRETVVCSVQFSSVAQSCPTLCDPMNRSTPGPPSITNSRSSLKLMSVESVMPSNHLTSVVPFSCLQSFLASGFYQVSSSHEMAKVLEFQL